MIAPRNEADLAEAMAADLNVARRQAKNTMTRMKSIFDTAADGLITMDENGQIDAFNPAAEKMFGCSAADIVGKNLSSLLTKPHAAQLDQQLQAHRNGEEYAAGPYHVNLVRYPILPDRLLPLSWQALSAFRW